MVGFYGGGLVVDGGWVCDGGYMAGGDVVSGLGLKGGRRQRERDEERKK